MSKKIEQYALDERMTPYSVRVTGKQVRKRRLRTLIAAIILLIAILLLGFSYGLSTFVNKAGHFTVVVPEVDKNLISLSETVDMKNRTTFLRADPVEDMDNITKAWLPENLDKKDGSHNGADYIAYTFYLKNTGLNEIDYSTQINIEAVTKESDHAVRVMIIKNGEEKVYAKPKKGSIEPEPDTIAFTSNTKVLNEKNKNFKVGDVDKYTVVIWLEGNDPECVDDIRGGVVKMSMNFKVLDSATEDS